MDQVRTTDAVDPTYTGLYRVGGVTALMVAFLTVIEVVFFQP